MTEKINWRVLNDRRPELAWTCDKLRMKDHVRQTAPQVAVPKTYWLGRDVGELEHVALPEHWVLKPNHRSGFSCLGDGVPAIKVLQEVTDGWLDEENNKRNGEWAYGQAQRTLLVEEQLIPAGGVLADYKFYAFEGVTKLIQVDVGRSGEEHTRNHYDEDWGPTGLGVGLPSAPPKPRPEKLDEMLQAVHDIAASFDFMRVDLYEVDGTVYFGETTPYPASGHARYEPRSADFEMGSHWKLPTKL